MKLRILILLFVALVGRGYAQTSGQMTQQQIGTWINSPVNFTSVSEAKNMIADIIEVIGIKQNFEIQAANVDNAAAVIYRGKRYILYNPDFINKLNAAAGNKWASVSILAHEIGHHLNGHTLENIGSQPAKELEADEFSGFVLRRMGATLSEAQAAMRIAADYKQSLTHPGKTDRLTAIAEGWNRANKQQNGKDLAKTTPVLKQNNDEMVYNDPGTQQRSQNTQTIRQPVIYGRTSGGAESSERMVTRRDEGNYDRRSGDEDGNYNRGERRNDGGYQNTRNDGTVNQGILADITFAAERQSSFYLTSEFNIVRELNNRLYSIGKMRATDNSSYPFIITDSNGTKLWVDNQGNILNGNSRSVGFLKVRR